MNIVIYSPIYELSEIIKEKLEENGESCFTFRKTYLLTEFIKNCKHLPDLLVLDYTTYNHDIFNLRNSLEEDHKLFPFIFFNDPCPVFPDKVIDWSEQLFLLFSIKDKAVVEQYKKIFTIIASVVEDPLLRPYIPLMQETLPFPEHLSKSNSILNQLKKTTPYTIYNFKKKNNLPENLFYLLQIFYDNRETPLSIQEIIDIFKADNKNISEDSLRVSISRLKKAIMNDKEFEFFMKKKNNTYQILFF